MSLPRFFRRYRLTWKLLSFLAFMLIGLYFFFGNKPTNSFVRGSEVGEEVLKFRRERFENYQASESSRTGPGEKGQGVQLHGKEKEKADSLMDKEAFNIIASDKISLERSVRDVRDARYICFNFYTFILLYLLS